ncbi:hypothetical protein P3X46_033599 [Hevea brasiliensis]|uniref:SAUR family protein n=1 Tax=Hevea brasiliensis TaxID=3981 RepID=A0ABQ9KCZ8_HEVBR|nr:auxin-responsive protein SAUR19-like [Hevea brasiliensis]KAJ9132762.1 hypothetical protein P3X46_033599 [Hevea brasiliensis]
MGIRLTEMICYAKDVIRRKSMSKRPFLQQPSAPRANVPRGHFVIYVGEEQKKKKRFVVPISYLKQPSFQKLLSKAEEEFGFSYPMGGLVLPCPEDEFIIATSHLNT